MSMETLFLVVIRNFLCRTFGKIVEFISLQTFPDSLFIQSFFVLGDSANIFEYFLFLLPEPYNLAKQNSFNWVVEYIDSQEEDIITFNFKVNLWTAIFFLLPFILFRKVPSGWKQWKLYSQENHHKLPCGEKTE